MGSVISGVGNAVGGLFGGGSSSKPPSQQDIKNDTMYDRDLQLINSQNALGGGTSYVKDPNAVGGVTQINSVGKPSQNIINNSLNALGAGFDLSNDAVSQGVIDRGTKDLKPYFEQQNESLEKRLAAQGIPMGSDAYNRAMQSQSDNQGRQINQYALSGREQGVNEAVLNQQQNMSNLSNILALNKGETPNVSVGNTGANSNAAYQNSSKNDPFNQALQIGTTVGSAALMSDMRQKKDVRVLGKTNNGLDIIQFKYISDKENRENIGLSAQDVQEKYPEAVIEKDGILYVNYEKALGAKSHG